MLKPLPLFALVLGTSLLAGCGDSQPTDADLRAAMQKQIEAVAGKSSTLAEELSTAKILGCKKAEPQGFNCDAVGYMGITQSVRMIKTDDGWRIVQGLAN